MLPEVKIAAEEVLFRMSSPKPPMTFAAGGEPIAVVVATGSSPSENSRMRPIMVP